MVLQATLKDVFESKPINDTQFQLTTKSYVERIALIRHFTALFQVPAGHAEFSTVSC